MIFAIVVFLVIISDQFVKYLVLDKMFPGQSVPLVENIFHLTYVQNKGAAFGILQEKTIVFIVLTVIITAIILFLYWKTREMENIFLFHIALAFLMGGALGNLIDRVVRGFVVDYLDFMIWPVFNIADIAIVFGVAVFLYYMFRYPSKI